MLLTVAIKALDIAAETNGLLELRTLWAAHRSEWAAAGAAISQAALQEISGALWVKRCCLRATLD